MKKLTVLLFFVLCFLYACDSSTESDIVGRWQLQKIDCADREIRVDSVYYNFHLNVFQLQIHRPDDIYMSARLWGMYSIDGDTLGISLKEEADLPAVLDWQERIRTRCRIETLTRSKLTLSRHDTIYYFRKF